MTVNKIAGCVATLGLMIFGSGTSQAAAVIDFELGGGGGGQISWAGGAAPLIGLNIPIGLVSSTSSPANSGATLNVTGSCAGNRGCLNFATGGLISNVAGVLTFAPGGSFAVTGGVALLGLSNNTVLENSSAAQLSIQNVGTAFSTATVSGSDTKDPALVTYFFGPSSAAIGSWELFGHLDDHVIADITKAFSTSELTSVDLGDVPVPSVPEPTSFLLFGTTMFGIAMRIHRLKRTKAEG